MGVMPDLLAFPLLDFKTYFAMFVAYSSTPFLREPMVFTIEF